MSYTEEDLQKGLKNYEDWAFQVMYKTQYYVIKNMVYNYHNKLLDPEDIFQEGLAELLHKFQIGNINIEKSVAAYFYGICRNICHGIFEKNKNNPIFVDPIYEKENDKIDNHYDNYYEKLNFIIKIKNQLKIECQKIIDLRFKLNSNGIEENDSTIKKIKLTSHDEIAEKLRETTANARQIFKRCMDRLREIISNDTEFKTLFDKP